MGERMIERMSPEQVATALENDDIWSPADLARYFGVHRQAIHRASLRGDLPETKRSSAGRVWPARVIVDAAPVISARMNPNKDRTGKRRELAMTAGD